MPLCYSQTFVHLKNLVTLHVQPRQRAQSCHDNIRQLNSLFHTPDLEQSGQLNRIQALPGTEISV